MAFQTPITIKEAVENIHSKKYLLPAIQREVVWGPDRICLLFDSLMRDYPIGSFLFWYVEKKNAGNYQFYEFVRDYHERDMSHNPKANVSGQDDITGILDGQQRLTALYIGLKGSYAYKKPRKRRDAFPIRKLYLNLLAPKKNGEDIDMRYDFAFLTDDESKIKNDDTFWFKVGDILDIKEMYQVNNYLVNSGLMKKPDDQAKFANETLFKLWEVVHKSMVINYYLVKDGIVDTSEGEKGLHKVLNIFVRLNSGGVELNYSDLLLSIATAQWKGDAREEITSFVDELNKIGDGFKFNKDFVLKSSLVLADINDIAFKVDNFNKSNMSSIEERWDQITSAIRGAVTLVSGFGYNRDTLTSNQAIIPIAYYLMKKDTPKNFDLAGQYADDRKAIQRWLILALVKRVFSGTPDSVLRPMREILRENSDKFPLDKVIDKFKGTNKSLIITEDDIENMLSYKYGEGYTFSTLALLYPSFDFRNKFHIDHIHPKSLFRKPKLLKLGISESDIDFYIDNVDRLPNLQLLPGIQNQEKSNTEFINWIAEVHPNEEDRKEYMKKHLIPETDLSLSNFKTFFTLRKDKLKQELCKILSVT